MAWNREDHKEPEYDQVRNHGKVIRLLEELRSRKEKEQSGFTPPGGLDVKFFLSPKIGSRNVGITSGIHGPGEGFEPHVHPLSEELLIVLEGSGEVFLDDKWIPVSKGDIVYAPEGVPHGTRNNSKTNEDLIMIGIGIPPQLDLYLRSGYYKMEDFQLPFGRSRLDDPPATEGEDGATEVSG